MEFLINLKSKRSTIAAIFVCFATSVTSLAHANSFTVAAGEQTRIAAKSDQPNDAEIAQTRTEVKQLEKLPQGALEAKANKGDPLAGLALAQQLSGEVQTLSGLPVLANNAAEDAARWYSLAARMGALQSQSVSGIGLKPLRATRRKHR